MTDADAAAFAQANPGQTYQQCLLVKRKGQPARAGANAVPAKWCLVIGTNAKHKVVVQVDDAQIEAALAALK